MTPDGAAWIFFLTPMPRLYKSVSLGIRTHVSRVVADWDLLDALSTELPRRGKVPFIVGLIPKFHSVQEFNCVESLGILLDVIMKLDKSFNEMSR